MKKKELFKILFFIFLIFLLLVPVTLIITNKENAEFITGFNEEPKDSLDILMIGGSKINRTIYPLQLWNDYGFVSYNLGSSNQNIPVSYYVTKYGIEQQHPDLIVLDVGRVKSLEKSKSDAMLHQIWDNLPLSYTKIQCIKDVADNKEALLLPFVEYHSRWTDLTSDDLKYPEDIQRGAGLYTIVSKYHYPDILDTNQKEALPEFSEEYLLKIIDLCKTTNTNLLLTGMPSGRDNKSEQRMYHTIADIASQNNINFLNFYELWDELGLDWEYAFANRGHLHCISCRVITDYVGNYINKNYSIADRRNDSSVKERWNSDYAIYNNYFESKVAETNVAINEAHNSDYDETSGSSDEDE